MAHPTPILPATALRTLARKSDLVSGLWLAGHLALVAAAGALVVAVRATPAAWPAMAALGVALMALFAPLHETTHRTVFRSVRANKLLGWLAGLVLVLPPEWFRLFHMAHHRHTQDPEHDPELADRRPLTRARYVWRLTGLPYWTAEIRLVLSLAAGHADAAFIPRHRRRAVVAEARCYLALYGTAIAGSLALRSDCLLWLYVVPALLGQPVLRAVLMAEHGGLPLVADRHANTRTTLSVHAVRLLFWNANYHAEHHLAAGVPFHALPRLHRLLAGLPVPSSGYAAAHRAIRQSFQAEPVSAMDNLRG